MERSDRPADDDRWLEEIIGASNPPPKPTSDKRPWIAVAAVAAVLLIGVGWLLRPGGEAMPQAPTAGLRADALSVERGAAVTLSWETTNATTVRLGSFGAEVGELTDSEIDEMDSVPPGGSRQVVPVEDTTYVIVARGDGGTISESVSIRVSRPAPTASLDADATSVERGEAITLAWSTVDAESVQLNGADVNLNGSLEVTPNEGTTYRLLAANSDGITVEESVFVAVTVPPPIAAPPAAAPPVAEPQVARSPATLSFTETESGVAESSPTTEPRQATAAPAAPAATLVASATSVEQNDPVTLTWDTANATDVRIEGVGPVEARGSQQVIPSGDVATYTLVATGPGGTVSRDVQITVIVEPVPEYRAGDTLNVCELCPEMVVIPAGQFMMGSPRTERDREDNEGPQHSVTLETFAMGRYEVTYDEYDAYARATARRLLNDRGWGRGRRPVVVVTWVEARAYATWLSAETGMNFRLPTEAEWEYAARAGTVTPFNTGDCISAAQANFNARGRYDECPRSRDYLERTQAVGSYPPNAFGLHDMHGNVWEWIEDCWHRDYEGAPADGRAWLLTDRECTRHPIRGGSWGNEPVHVRVAHRRGGGHEDRHRMIGFRLVLDLP